MADLYQDLWKAAELTQGEVVRRSWVCPVCGGSCVAWGPYYITTTVIPFSLITPTNSRDAEFAVETVNKGLAMQRYLMASLERADMMFEARRKMDQGANRISEDKPK